MFCDDYRLAVCCFVTLQCEYFLINVDGSSRIGGFHGGVAGMESFQFLLNMVVELKKKATVRHFFSNDEAIFKC